MLYFSGLVVDCVVVFAVNGYIGVDKRLCCVVRVAWLSVCVVSVMLVDLLAGCVCGGGGGGGD